MSWRNSVVDHVLDLPPPYDLVVLRESGDAFAHACAIAGARGAGTLVWVRRYDLAEFAVVLEPDDALVQARRAIYAGMSALAGALAAHAPPSLPVTFNWPDAIRIDGALIGGGRLGWPEGTRDDEIPPWLVFSAMIRTSVVHGPESGLRPMTAALDELGFETADAGEIISSFSRHLMAAFHDWNEDGFASLARKWLDRLPPGERDLRIDEAGDLLLQAVPDQSTAERRSLGKALAVPTWLDPSTATPWL
jgi:biotin-(acetyl-CoA carboxylase) ligase